MRSGSTSRSTMQRWRRGMVALVAAALFVPFLSACQISVAGERDILRIGTTYPIDSLNPFVSEADYAYVAYQYIYPALTQYDAGLHISPYFATSWSTSADGRAWTFHTVPNAQWSDGSPLNADDVAWTINMIVHYQNGPTASAAGTVANVTKAVATGPNTVVIHYSRPVANVLEQLQQLPILPEQVWGPLATGKAKGLRRFQNSAPVVSGGPFILENYQTNHIALFKDNPKWWGTPPHIKGFGLEFFSNADAMVSALETGQLDMIGEYTPATTVAALHHAKLDVTTAPSLSLKDFIINTNPKKKDHRELLNPVVREAMDDAVDRAQIVKTAWLGYAQPGNTLIAPADESWQDKTIPAPTFNLATANRLLDQAGYKRGSNGIRTAAGHPMSYALLFLADERGPGDRTFQIIQNDFKEIGIRITEDAVDDDAGNAAILAPNNKYQDFDLAMWDWVPPVDPDFLLSVLTCGQWGNNSDSGFCDPAYDKLYREQAEAISPAKRHRIVDQMQVIIHNQRPYLILDYPDVIEAHSPAWTGFVQAPVMGSVNSLSTVTLLSVHRVG